MASALLTLRGSDFTALELDEPATTDTSTLCSWTLPGFGATITDQSVATAPWKPAVMKALKSGAVESAVTAWLLTVPGDSALPNGAAELLVGGPSADDHMLQRSYALNVAVRLLTDVRDSAPESLHPRINTWIRHARRERFLMIERLHQGGAHLTDDVPLVRTSVWSWMKLLTSDDLHDQHYIAHWADRRLQATTVVTSTESDPIESEISRVLFEGDTRARLSPLVTLAPAGTDNSASTRDRLDLRRALVSVLESWFLPRFDFRGATRLVRAIAEDTRGRRPTTFVRSGVQIALGDSTLALGIPFALLLLAHTLHSQNSAVAYALGGLAGTAILLRVVGTILLTTAGIPAGSLAIPRLAAGVLGATPIVLSLPNTITNKLSADDASMIVATLAAFAALFCFLYLFAEVRRNIGPFSAVSRDECVYRALFVLGHGVFYALAAGTFCAQLTDGSLTYLALAATIALVGGVILQILWENSATTAPPV